MSQEPITTRNWGYAPFNRTSFSQVQQLFPTARISRGAGPVSPPAPNPKDSLKLNLGDFVYSGPDGQPRSVNEMLDSTFTDAFLVAQHGDLLHEAYFGPMAPHSLHLLNSVTKSLVGMLAGIQIDKGCFKASDLVSQHVPELASGAFKQTQVRHLLDMTAAVAFGEDYADPEADFWKETEVVGWRPQLRTPKTPAGLVDYATSLQATEQLDGEKYHYRTVLTNVLGMVIERTAGEPLQQLLEHNLWSRLHPEQDLAVVVDPVGFPYVGAGGNACARDLLRFGQMLVQEGKLNGQQIVPKSWIDDTRYATDQAREHFAASAYADMVPGGHYRNQVWVGPADRGEMYAIGIHGQTIYANLLTDVVIVKLSSQPESADMPLFADTFAAMQAMSEQLAHTPENKP